MTEAEWLNCGDPLLMIEIPQGQISDRKLRLFAVACCRRFRGLLVPEAGTALEIAERFADGIVGSEERKRSREIAFHLGWVSDLTTRHRRGPAKAAVCDALARRARDAAANVVSRAIYIGAMETIQLQGGELPISWKAAKQAQAESLAELLQCITGNPFRAEQNHLSWLSENKCAVVELAQRIYRERDFSSLPILANALEEAGCDNASILNHCRKPGLHGLGCWVIDLLLWRS